MPAESIHEKQPFNVKRWSNDRVMVRRHLVKPGPSASRIYTSLRQNRNARCGSRQYLLDEGLVELRFETRRLIRIIPGQQNPPTFAAKMKSRRHVDHHWKPLW